MPIFYVYDMTNIKANESISIEGSLEDAAELLSKGPSVYQQHIPWSTVKWSGVYTPRFIPNPVFDIPESLATYLEIFKEQNKTHRFDATAVARFERKCKRMFGINVDVRYIPKDLGHWEQAPKKFRTAILDGESKARLINWALQPPSVAIDGSLIEGADPKTVVYNTDDEGSFWLARWKYKNKHYFTTLTDPYFEDVTDAVEKINNELKSAEETVMGFDETGEICYRRETEPEPDESDDDILETERDIDDVEGGSDYEEDDEKIGVDFDYYTIEEQTMLPLGYMIPRSVEWQYVMNAIESNFVQVKNMVKVRDYTLLEFFTLLGGFDINAKYLTGAKRLLKYIKLRIGKTPKHDITTGLERMSIQDD